MSYLHMLKRSVGHRSIQCFVAGAFILIALGAGGAVGYAQQVKLTRHLVSAAAVKIDGMKGSVGQPAIGRALNAPAGGIFGFWASRGTTTTSTDAPPLRPSALHVETYPNPFREQTSFRIDLPRDADLRIDIMDAAGRIVSGFQLTHMQQGNHSIPWSAHDSRGTELPSGAFRAIITSVDAFGGVTRSASVLLIHTR